MVDRPRLLPGEVEPAQQPPDPALAVADAEAALDQLAQVAGAPGDAAVALQPRTPQDEALQGGLPPLVERARPARPRPVAQALDPFRVVAVHPVAQGLPVHAGGPRRLVPAQIPASRSLATFPAPASTFLRSARGRLRRRGRRRGRSGDGRAGGSSDPGPPASAGVQLTCVSWSIRTQHYTQ